MTQSRQYTGIQYGSDLIVRQHTDMDMSLSGGRIVTAPGRVTHVHLWSGFKTCHGLMPMKCLQFISKKIRYMYDITMLTVYFECK